MSKKLFRWYCDSMKVNLRVIDEFETEEFSKLYLKRINEIILRKRY